MNVRVPPAPKSICTTCVCVCFNTCICLSSCTCVSLSVSWDRCFILCACARVCVSKSTTSCWAAGQTASPQISSLLREAGNLQTLPWVGSRARALSCLQNGKGRPAVGRSYGFFSRCLCLRQTHFLDLPGTTCSQEVRRLSGVVPSFFLSFFTVHHAFSF